MDAVVRQRLSGLGLVAAIAGLPLLGAVLAGRDVSRVFLFPPPLEVPTDYVRFSWTAVALVGAAVVGLSMHWAGAARGRRRAMPVKPSPEPSAPVPLAVVRRARQLGFAAAGCVAVSWVLAWTRMPWFEPWQRYTFFPLWIGFIVGMNAWAEARTGTSMMRRQPGAWLGLFALSAAFWWLFEWLNRFVRNWHYLAVEDFSPAGYALHATLCFSTVLPAVAAVAEWLASHPGWRRATVAGPRWPWLARPGGGWVLVVGGVAALLLTGGYPTFSYPALWVAPLALLLGIDGIRGRRGVGVEVAAGDWSRAATWMIAALLCGVCWELWNWHSLAKWIYTVPGVERWHVFEMPLPGYAGYLPFGLECLVMIEWAGVAARRPAPETSNRWNR